MDWLKGAIDYGVIGFLTILSIVAITIALERYMVYIRIRIDEFTDKKLWSLSSQRNFT